MRNISSDNLFTSEKLNRLGEKRNDYEWISKQLDARDTLFIPLWEEKNLINVSGDPCIVFLDKREISEIMRRLPAPTLIGSLDGRIYFSVPVTGTGPETEKLFAKFGTFVPLRRYAAHFDRDEAAMLSYANALNNWQMRHLHCGKCGSRTKLAYSGHRLDCSDPSCDHQSFPRTDPAIITLIHREDKCLLVRQLPWKPGQYALVAGFVEPGESFESAVARETYEETGIELDDITYFSTQPWPFPGSVMVGFFAHAVTEKITLHDGELEEAKWMTRDEIEKGLRDKTMRNPTKFSIAYRLLETWFDREGHRKLSDIISEITAGEK